MGGGPQSFNNFTNGSVHDHPTGMGVSQADGNNNFFWENDFYNNNFGFYLGGGMNNEIWNNNFYDNNQSGTGRNAEDMTGGSNIWNHSGKLDITNRYWELYRKKTS